MRTILIALLALICFSDGLLAQQRIAVLTEPGTAVVAVEFMLTVGPVNEGTDEEGITYLAARSVVRPLQETLDSLGARLTIRPEKDAISVSVISAPDAWEDATAIVARGLLRAAPDTSAVVAERAAIVDELRGRIANPADAATRELEQAFFGLGHPWGRPTVGTPESVGRLRFGDVEEFLRENFTPDRVLVAVVGPIEEAAVRSHLRPLIGNTFPAAIEIDPFRSAERPVREEYNSITTWVSVSIPFEETADHEAIRFLGHLAADALSFSLTQSSVYNVSTEVTRRVGGGELRLQIVVPPEEADEWEERVSEIARDLETRTLLPDVYADQLRSYRGQRLMMLLGPEDRAHAAARQLLVQGSYTGLIPELETMSQARVRSAAESLGPPTVVVLGPRLDN